MAAAIESLPSELVCNITERLLGACAFGSVAALARGSRRLYLRVAPLLYDNVGRVNRHAGQDGLIWAAEHDEVRVLRSLLECGVDPNACFWSGLPHSVCQEVFTAQRLRRRLSPRVDGHLVAKLVREYLVWNQEHVPGLTPSGERELLRAWYLATINGDIPEYLPTWELDVVHGGTICVAEMVDAARFSCRPGSHSEPADSLYSWTALHVATQRGNGQAVEALLLQGADIELKCQGLCDCLTPTGSRFGTQERPPIWTALHIAICSGHEHVARILLSRGANYLTVGQMTTHDPRLVAPEDGITAFHSAALRGNVAMCQLLLDHHVASSSETGNDVLELEDSRGLRALDYAVAAGHTRTAGSWLLEHGADPLQAIALNEREFLAPLNFLCFRGQYRDAQYLLDRIQCRPADYTLALQSCFMWLLTRDQSFARTVGYLRHFLDGHMEYMEDVVSDNPPLLEHDSEDALICLVKRLLEDTPPPSPDNIMEVLAMALDVGSQEPEPAVIRTLVENTAVDVSTLITRPVKAARIGNRIKGHVPPLYYLLKTFYKAHIIPKSTPGHAADTSAPASSWHDCDCPFKTRDGYLASSVGILVQHGASWLQPSQPSGETPLDVLAAILDGQDFDADVGPWPCHNRETLRSHVKLDWRASGVAGRLLGGRFNPIEVDGLEARWA
ncbi:ankyrin repeat-containing domain protein [Chaetomidium leptoderma]|uniref:Ankyrin repeat-containing domain protein n=1 Tax=Chaetomidium leptoderma TaxID=669021 RepID=A0AAN6ZW07_9PEZI|nr:ankyrin repeat-containing domain protein [Chaetomidium leptoderma]